MIPLCLCDSTVSCLLFTAMASLASVCSHFFWIQLWNLICVHSSVRQTHVLKLCLSVFQMSMAAGQEMSGHHQPSNTKKRRRWGGLRQQWKLLGLFEIDQQHEFYALTCMIKEGLAAVTQNTDDNAPTVSIAQPFRKQHIWEGAIIWTIRSVIVTYTANLVYLLPVVPLGNVSLFHIDGLRWLSEAT